MAMAKTAAAKAKRDAENSRVKRGRDEESVDELPLFKKVLQLPEPAEVGVRFCKPGKRRHRSVKLDTEDSDTEDSDMSTNSRPTVNR